MAGNGERRARWLRRGGVEIKTVLAAAFAVGGLTWAAVSMLSGRDSAPEPKGPRVIASALDDQGNAVEPQYSKAKSGKQLDLVREHIGATVSDQSRAVLGGIRAPKGSARGVSEAVANAFVPVLTGDHDAFLAAIVAMGGEVPGEIDGEHPIFSFLAKAIEGAKVDLSRVSVRRYEEGDTRTGPTMTRQRDEEREEGKPGINTNVMEIQPQTLFADAPDKSDATALDVRIPVQPKGETHESVFSVILTWNPEAKLWQPAAYRIIKQRLIEQEG